MISKFGCHHVPGEQITVTRKVGFNPDESALEPYLSYSAEELHKMQLESVSAETAIVNELSALADKWGEQAAMTTLLGKAQVYLEYPPVTHTSNVWITNDSAEHEISNMVYIMRYHITKKTDYDRNAGNFKAPAWYVSWFFGYNRPHRRDIEHIFKLTEQSGKRFRSEEAAKAYMQKQIETYAAKFEELSPPIPEDDKRMFYVSGTLLPGYTVAAHEPTTDELLAFVGDADIVSDPPEQQDTHAQRSAAKKQAHNRHVKRK